jgi:hypothetical protein
MIASSSSNRTTCSRAVGTKDSKFHFAFGFCGPLAHIFKAARSCQRLENVSSTQFFYVFILVVVLMKGAFRQNYYQDERVGFLRGILSSP